MQVFMFSESKKLSTIIMVICLSLFVYYSNVQAENNAFPTVTFITGEWKPFISEELEGYGVVSKIIQEAGKRAGIEPVIKFRPWKRCMVEIQKGSFVASFSWKKTVEREKLVTYSDNWVIRSAYGVFYKKSNFPNGVKFDDFSDLVPYNARVVGISGYWYEKELDNVGIDFHNVNLTEQAWKIFSIDRAQFYIHNYYVGMMDAKRVMPDIISDLGYSEYKGDNPYSYVIYSRQHKDTEWVKPKMDEALESMHKDGTIEKIYNTLLE